MKTTSRARGFNLFELLLVLAIISMLAAIAYPVYTHAIIKTRRTEAKIALLHLANRMEVYYLENNNSYAGANLPDLGFKKETDNNFYELSLNSTSQHYELTATARFTDAECHCFMLNELGEKTSTGNLQQCW
jgi:type IV pilus assembly protein PilE